MLELWQITSDPALAQRCEAMGEVLGRFRLWIDLERHGKAERQAGRNTFISTHVPADIDRLRPLLRHSRLMVRVNPLHDHSAAEVDDVLARGADVLMLPMFRRPEELARFVALVAGRVPVVPLLETREALASLNDWIGLAGLGEVYVGLNDLHLSLGCRFMFEPLADGHVDRVAQAARAHGLRFGFGGIARLDGGLLSGRDVLAEHVRLGSAAVILSRTFHGDGLPGGFEAAVAALRQAEAELAARGAADTERDRLRIAARIREIAAGLAAPQAERA